MRNRDKLNQMSLVDLLWKIQCNEGSSYNCIITLITGKTEIKRCDTYYDEKEKKFKCYDCLSDWLNEKI